LNVDDTNRLYDIVGPFVGLGEDETVFVRFRDLDTEDEAALSAIIEEFLLSSVCNLSESDRNLGLAVVAALAAKSRELQLDEWDSMLPPFSYPEKLNLFWLIYDRLTAATAH
jgi:hypothetical protein